MIFLNSFCQFGWAEFDDFSAIFGSSVFDILLIAALGFSNLNGNLRLRVYHIRWVLLHLVTLLARLVTDSVILTPRFSSANSSLMQSEIMIGKLTVSFS